jgi:hypothetical protein
MLPTTRVKNNAYLHAFITTNGVYCNSKSSSGYDLYGAGDQAGDYAEDGNHLFRVWPNPTSGPVTLELLSDDQTGEAKIELYGMLGNLVMQTTLSGSNKYDLSLADKPNGIYLMKVVTGKLSRTVKIIKQ